MSELKRASRAIVDAARHGDDPTAHDRERVRAALLASLGGGVVVASSTAAAASTSSASAATAAAAATTVNAAAGTATTIAAGSFGLAAKAMAALAVMSVVGVGVTLGVHHTRVPSQPSTRAPAQFSTPTPPSTRTPTLTPPPPPTPPPTLTPTPAPTPAPTPTLATTLTDEVHLLSAARAALRTNRPADALTLLDEHAARFGAGALAPERAAARVLALCSLGRAAEAHEEAARFLAAYARSPMAPRVASACAGAR